MFEGGISMDPPIPYCGAAPSPEAWLGRWNFDPLLMAGLAAVAMMLWHPRLARDGVRGLRSAWALAVLLYVSPLCALSSAFFTVRVLHHIALVLVLAPLLAQGVRQQRVRVPLWPCTAIAALVFWLWHAPAPYAAALSSSALYWLMQFTLLASATAFWLAVRRAGPALAMAAVLVTMVQMGLLGALITFAARPLYEPHLASTLAWGVSPLQDQQTAGVLMWAPASLAYLAAALAIGWRWLHAQPWRGEAA